MPDTDRMVFLSYRRDVSSFIARAIFLDLRANGYDVFMDVESIDSGQFETIILNQIAARPHFLVILTPGAVDRCAEPGDWLRREIEMAMDLGRNVVPILVNNFSFEASKAHLTGKLEGLQKYSGLDVPHNYFDAAMERLRTKFLKRPVSGAIQPAPAADQPTVSRKIEEAASEPPPTQEQLTAEQYFFRGLVRHKTDIKGRITDYSESIRLNPYTAPPYSNRGIAYYDKGDYDAAILDFDKAIGLGPKNAIMYSNRGSAYSAKGNFDAAIRDYDEAIRLDPESAPAYADRGWLHLGKREYDEAIRDYNTAIRLDPEYSIAYNNRGYLYNKLGEFEAAIRDLDEAIRLDSNFINPYSHRAESYLALAQPSDAIDDFRKSLELQPNYGRAVVGLPLAWYVLGEIDEARRLWRDLLAADPMYRDAEAVSRKLNWHPKLVEIARQLIASL